MRGGELPGLSNALTNGLQLNRQFARAVGSIQAYRSTNGAEPPSAAALVGWIDAAKAFILAGEISEGPVEGEVLEFNAGIFSITAGDPDQHLTGYLTAEYSPTAAELGSQISGPTGLVTAASFNYNGPLGEPLSFNRSVLFVINKPEESGLTAIKVDWPGGSKTYSVAWSEPGGAFAGEHTGLDDSPFFGDGDPFTLTFLY